MKPIQAVIFDAGNTMVFVNPVRVLEIFRGLGVETELARFQEAQRQTRLLITKSLMAGSTDPEAHVAREYYLSLCRLSGVPPHLESEANRCLKEVNRLEHLWTHVDEDTPEALRAISGMGYRMAVVSNSDGRVDWLLRQRGLRDHFEFVIDSHDFGAEKPDPRIFRAATERLGLEPEACLYVGDLYPIDVVGARAAGLQAVLLDPWDQLDVDVDRIPSVAHLPEYLRSRQVVTAT